MDDHAVSLSLAGRRSEIKGEGDSDSDSNSECIAVKDGDSETYHGSRSAGVTVDLLSGPPSSSP